MPATLPVRSGFRVSGAEMTSPEYAHPPLVESWLAVDLVEGRVGFELDAARLRERLGPEWSGSWREVPKDSKPDDGKPRDQQLGNVMGDRAVRLTKCGFAFGWLGHHGERYPRYEAIRDGFVSTLDAVRDVAGCNDQDLTPRRWSVRYVNRVPQGTVWMMPGDWSFFRLWQPVPLQGLGIESPGYKARWELPLDAERGTLTVKFRHEPGDIGDGLDQVWITLQARGPSDGTDADLFVGLDYGREVIVRAFNELVSAAAKAYWGGVSRRTR